MERKLQVCLPCAARTKVGIRRKADLQTFEVGIRFHTVAADIMGVHGLTDYFTKNAVTLSLVQTKAYDVAKAILEN